MTDQLLSMLGYAAHFANTSALTDYLTAVHGALICLADKPVAVLYIGQSVIYAFAAISSRRTGHKVLSICYGSSCCIQGLLALCYLADLA
jgi:hypothetical protein